MTAETILNLVWLALTLAVLWIWRFRWSVSRRILRHSTRLQAVAILCFIAFVFPVISLTDDLHPEIVAVDAASGKRNACLHVAAVHARSSAPGSKVHSAVETAPAPVVLTQFASEEVFTLAGVSPSASVVGTIAGRSPPFVL